MYGSSSYSLLINRTLEKHALNRLSNIGSLNVIALKFHWIGNAACNGSIRL